MSLISKTAIATGVGIATVAGVSTAHADANVPVTTPVAPKATEAPKPEKTDFQKAQDAEAQKLADTKATQTASEKALADANKDAETAKAASQAQSEADIAKAQNANVDSTAKAYQDDEASKAEAQKVAESQALDAQKQADANAQAQHDTDVAKANADAQAQKDAATAQAKAAHDAQVAQQAKDAEAFANKQAQETGSAQAQRDAETANYNDAVANQKAQSAQTDTQIDNTLKDGTASAQKANADQNAQADANQSKATADAQATHDSAKATQSATNADTENKVKAQNADFEKTASKAVSDAQYNVDHPNSTPATPGNRTAENSDIDSPAHQINTEGNLPTAISDPHIDATHQNDAEYYDYYIYSATHDTTAKINGDATSAQQKELADYAMTLINSYRQQKGLQPLLWTKEAQQAVEASAKLRENEDLGLVHTNRASNTIKNGTASAYKALGIGMNSENLGMSSGEQTMLSAKTNILNIITAMIYQDGASFNGHRLNFESSIPMMGFALQKWSQGYIYIFQGSSVYDTHSVASMHTTSTAEIEAARGGNTQANREALAQAQKVLTDLQTKNAQTLKDTQNQGNVLLQAIDDNLTNTLAQIKATHDAQIETNNKNAQDQIATLTAQSAKAHADNLSDLNTKLGQLEANHEFKMSNIKDLTPEELANKKAGEKQEFEKAQTIVLSQFDASQDAQLQATEKTIDVQLQKTIAALDATLAQNKQANAQVVAQLKDANQKAFAQLVTDHQNAIAKMKAFYASQLATAKARNAADLKALIAKNAKALQDLQNKDLADFAKAQADSQAYLDSINPQKKHNDTKPADNNNKPATNNDSHNNNDNHSRNDNHNIPVAPAVNPAHNTSSNVPAQSHQASSTNNQSANTSVTPVAQPQQVIAKLADATTTPAPKVIYNVEAQTLNPVIEAPKASSVKTETAPESQAPKAQTITASQAPASNDTKAADKTKSELPHASVSQKSNSGVMLAAAVAVLLGIIGFFVVKARKNK